MGQNEYWLMAVQLRPHKSAGGAFVYQDTATGAIYICDSPFSDGYGKPRMIVVDQLVAGGYAGLPDFVDMRVFNPVTRGLDGRWFPNFRSMCEGVKEIVSEHMEMAVGIGVPQEV